MDRTASADPSSSRSRPVADWLERLALLVLLSVVLLRPLVAETYDAMAASFAAALPPLSDPSAVRTVVFDVLILGAGCLWLLARAIAPLRPYTRTGLEWGLVLLVPAVIASCAYAGNQRLAINASLDWLCLVVLAITLAQLVHRAAYRRLLLAVVLGAACVQAAQCVEQHFLTFEDTWNHYQSIKDSYWAERGIALDSPTVDLFERRMKAREAQGYFPHSNVAGSYLVLCALAAAGVTLARWRALRERAAGTIPERNGDAACSPSAVPTLLALGGSAITAALIFAAWLTGSLGAILAGAAAAVLWVGYRLVGRKIVFHSRRAFCAAWGLVALGAAGVVAWGVIFQSLPHWSLHFRWLYWRSSWPMLLDHWLTGVGRENFRRVYLSYKPMEVPEEIANPHNFLVQAAAEWGLGGLIAVVVMLLGSSWMLTRARHPANGRANPILPDRDSHGSTLNAVCWGAVLFAVLIVARLPLLGVADVHYVYYLSGVAALAWLAGFACFLPGTAAGAPGGFADTAHRGVVAGLFAFVLHDLINFALFVPGSATVFFALFACGVSRAGPPPGGAPPSLAGRWFPAFAGLSATILALAMIAAPVCRSDSLRNRAEARAREPFRGPLAGHPADRLFLQAAAADPLDPTAYRRRAAWLMSVAAGEPAVRDEALALAGASLDAAAARDPRQLDIPRARLHAEWMRAVSGAPGEHYRAAVHAGRQALALYPLDPDWLVVLAEVEAQAGGALSDAALERAAAAHYEEALALDAARPAWAQLGGFTPQRRAEIEARLRELRRALDGNSPGNNVEQTGP